MTSVSAKTMASTLTMMVMMTMATKTTRIATLMAIMITTVFTMAMMMMMMMMMMVNMMIMTTAKIIIMNLRNRTGEERKQPTLCDRRDNIFVQKTFLPNFVFL